MNTSLMDKDFSEVTNNEQNEELNISKGTIEVPVQETKPRRRKVNNVISNESQTNISTSDDELIDQTVNTVINNMKEKWGIAQNIDDLISQQQIDEWKLQYGDIYKTTVGDQTFLWHKMKRKDYINLMTDEDLSQIENMDLKIFIRQEKILKGCIIYPDQNTLAQLIDTNAGLASTISDEIMLNSGFKPPQTDKM